MVKLGGLAPEDNQLSIYVIYDHPKDYPYSYVVRLFLGDKPTEKHWIYPTLEKARALCINRGLVQLARSPTDDPVIVETWI